MDHAFSHRYPRTLLPETVAKDAGGPAEHPQRGTLGSRSAGGSTPDSSATSQSQSHSHSQTQAVSGPAPVRVLVVDDQPDVLATTVELFKIMGYEVLWASNGYEAVAILEKTPDLQVLFSDVVMPGMSGLRLAVEARRLIPGINVILASGFQAPAVDAQGANVHDFHFLSKPFRMTDIAKMLRR
jgi:CheY-like chemotaxis protein